MTPLVALWPQADTAVLAAKTAFAMRSAGFGDKMFRSEGSEALAGDGCADTLRSCYRGLIDLAADDTTLHCVGVVTMNAEGAEAALRIIEAISSLNHSVSLEIIALWGVPDETGKAVAPDRDAMAAAVKAMSAVAAGASFHCTVTPVDDYVSSGATIGFDRELLSRYLAAYMTMLIENYGIIYSPAMCSGNKSGIVGIGLSQLLFDRKGAISALQHRALADAVERAGLAGGKVNIAEASTRAAAALAGIDRFFDTFYRSTVQPLHDAKLDQSTIVARVTQPLADAIAARERDFSAFLDDNKLSLPEKEATLALVLGRDNPRLEGLQFNAERPVLDDALSEPLEMYIDAFNDGILSTGSLPVRNDYPDLKLYEFSETANKMVPSAANKLAFNPIGDLKELKSRILDLTAQIRTCEAEYDALRKIADTQRRVDSEKAESEFRPSGRLVAGQEIKEQPLDRKYQPAPGTRPRKSVDLRAFFSPVKDQGSTGSCSTFAIVSVYEAAMNRSAGPTSAKALMSEKFVFWHSNVLKGKPEGGSNFFDQLAVLGSEGVCHERLYESDFSSLREPPSATAVAEALQHRVLQAEQIELQDEGDKVGCIRANHRLITSALSEGFPVPVALKVYRSFETATSPFVAYPDADDIASGDAGYHAMVLVGYSDDDKCYIVRNSWGEEFGDKGYCYIASNYIDDPEYCNFALIVRATTDDGNAGQFSAPELTAPFAGTEALIRMAALRNTIDDLSLSMKGAMERYKTTYSYYQALMGRLKMPSVRSSIVADACVRLTDRRAILDKRRREIVDSFAASIKEFRSRYLTICVVATVATVASACLAWILSEDGSSVLWIVAGSIAFVTLLAWLNLALAVRRHKNQLNEEAASLAADIAGIDRQLAETHLRFHVAGMFIDSFSRMQLSLEKRLQNIVSFNHRLEVWYADDSRLASMPQAESRSMFVVLNDSDLLDAFYRRHCGAVVDGIDLPACFKAYDVNNENIEDLRKRLLERTSEAIGALMAGFSIEKLLRGESFDFVTPIDRAECIRRLLRLADICMPDSSGIVSSPVIFAGLGIPAGTESDLRDLLRPCFGMPPQLCAVSCPDTFTILAVRPVS